MSFMQSTLFSPLLLRDTQPAAGTHVICSRASPEGRMQKPICSTSSPWANSATIEESSSRPDLTITVEGTGMTTFHSAPGHPHQLPSMLDLCDSAPVGVDEADEPPFSLPSLPCVPPRGGQLVYSAGRLCFSKVIWFFFILRTSTASPTSGLR